MPDLMTRFDNKSGKLREIDNRKIYKNARFSGKNQRKTGIFEVWQGKHDSNMQPTVLETATLPLSYSPMKFSFISI